MRFLYGLLSLGLFFNTVFGETGFDEKTSFTVDRSENGKARYIDVTITDQGDVKYEKLTANMTTSFSDYRDKKERSNMSDELQVRYKGDKLDFIRRELQGYHEYSYPRVLEDSLTEVFYFCDVDGKLMRVDKNVSDKEISDHTVFFDEHSNGHGQLDSVSNKDGNSSKPTEQEQQEFQEYMKSSEKVKLQAAELNKRFEDYANGNKYKEYLDLEKGGRK